MIDKFDKNDGLRIFSFTVFAVLIINLLYSMLLTVFPSCLLYTSDAADE